MTRQYFKVKRACAALGALALASLTYVAPVAPAHAEGACDGVEVINAGHVDAFEAKVTNGKLDLVTKWDKPTGRRVFTAPEKTVIHLGEHTLTDVPGDLPVPEGVAKPTRGYFTGQAEDKDRPWIGWDFMSAAALGDDVRSATLHLDKVSGPGTISLWLQRSVPRSATPLTQGKKTLEVASGDKLVDSFLSHKHFNWLFSKPGVYTIEAHLEAGKHRSPVRTYYFAIGSSPDNACQKAKETSSSTEIPPSENGSDGATETSTGKPAGGERSVGTFAPGDTIELNASSFDPNGGAVTFTFDDPKTVLASATPDSKGNVVKVTGKLPADAKDGEHTITVAQGKKSVALRLTIASQKEEPEEAGNGAVVVVSGDQQQAASVAQGQSSPSVTKTEVCLPTKVSRKISAEEAKRYGAGTTGITLTPMMKDDRTTPAKWVDPQSLTFGLGPAAKMEAPAELRPLGISGTVHMIGATQVPGVPWLGANTQNDSVVSQVDGPVTWKLENVVGPGKLVVFESGNFGKVVGKMWFRNVGDTYTLGLHTHVHPNWIFSAPGTYKVTISETAKLKSGQTVSGQTTLTFLVGSQGNANEGHFDLGAEIGAGGATNGATVTKNADGSYTLTEVVGRTPSGKPCVLGGSLAKTGSSDLTIPLAILGAGLLVGGLGFTLLRREFLLKR